MDENGPHFISSALHRRWPVWHSGMFGIHRQIQVDQFGRMPLCIYACDFTRRSSLQHDNCVQPTA